MNEDDTVREYLKERNKLTGNMLNDDELLLNSFEHAALCVAAGADVDTPAFIMYAYGRRLILQQWNWFRIRNAKLEAALSEIAAVKVPRGGQMGASLVCKDLAAKAKAALAFDKEGNCK